MESLLWAVILWLLVFILIPIGRIKLLWPVAVISFIWMFILNYIFIRFGYYQFMHQFAMVGGVPLLIPVGGAAGGILLINWMQRNPLFKIFIILVFAGFLHFGTTIFISLEAFMMYFNHFLHFAVNIAGVSILIFLSFAFVDEESIYEGNKTRFNIK